MVFDFDPGALLGRFYPLADGSRVGLRVARPSDAAAIRDLVASHGEASHSAAELDIRRLVNYDPRHCCVICATALVDQGEQMIGVGSIELGEVTGGGREPELVLVAPVSVPLEAENV